MAYKLKTKLLISNFFFNLKKKFGFFKKILTSEIS